MPAPAPRPLDTAGAFKEPKAPLPIPILEEQPQIPVTQDFEALPDNGATIPPDTMGAAGPNHLMTMLNSEVRIQDKQGNNLSTVTLDTFWTVGTGLSGNTFDPRIIFDSLSNRWMATVDVDGNSATSRIFFAVSDTTDPTDTWTFYSFDSDPTNQTWADFPDIGANSKWVAITNNMFGVSSSGFVGVKMWVIDKSTLGGPLTVTIFNPGFDVDPNFSTSGSTIRVATAFDAAESNLFLVDNSGVAASVNGTPSTPLLRFSRITGTGASPSWEVVPGSQFLGTGLFPVVNGFEFTQINASQAGTATRVQTNDIRMLNAVFRNGRVWCTHTAGLPFDGNQNTFNTDRTAVFWYQLDPGQMESTGDPIVQSGVLAGGTDVHHFFPSIAVNSQEDVAIGFSRSDLTKFIEAVATGRQSADPTGTMDPIAVFKTGEDSYEKDFGSGRVRWGDYSATVVDPTDDFTFWTIQEYAKQDVGPNTNDDRWGTWWAQLSFPSIESRLINISTRARVETGDNIMIGGFKINASKTVLIRARGPSMPVSGTLNDPQVRLVNQDTGTIIASNDDWQDAPNAADIQATGKAPSNAMESAILMTFNPNTKGYTALVSGVGGTTGLAIVEVLDLD